jgi:hypothetical protein
MARVAPVAKLVADRPVALSDTTRIEVVPVLRDGFIAPGRAIVHPALDEPVAYLGDVAIVPLLAGLDVRRPMSALIEGWARVLPRAQAEAVARWAVERGVLVQGLSLQGP